MNIKKLSVSKITSNNLRRRRGGNSSVDRGRQREDGRGGRTPQREDVGLDELLYLLLGGTKDFFESLVVVVRDSVVFDAMAQIMARL